MCSMKVNNNSIELKVPCIYMKSYEQRANVFNYKYNYQLQSIQSHGR